MQLAIAWDAAHVGAEDWDVELGWFRRAVEAIGHKEVAYKLDVQPSNLTDALLERERKDVKGRWISTVRRMVSPILIEEYVRLICESHGFETPKRAKPKTAEEDNRAIREFLKDQAPALLALYETKGPR